MLVAGTVDDDLTGERDEAGGARRIRLRQRLELRVHRRLHALHARHVGDVACALRREPLLAALRERRQRRVRTGLLRQRVQIDLIWE